MIISEKQIMQLISIAQLYACEIRLNQPHDAEPIEEFLRAISNQQSEELKVIE